MASSLVGSPLLTGTSFTITADGQAPTQVTNFNVVASTITVASGGITPVASDLFAGDSASDLVNFATFAAQANYETDFPSGTILPVEVIIEVGISPPGGYDETTPFAEDDLVTVTFRVPDSNGSFEDFVIGPITVQGVVVPPPVVSSAPFTLRQNIIELPDDPTNFEITGAPATGRFYERSDNRLGVDLTDVQAPVDLTVNYNDLSTGSPVAKSVLIQPQLGFERFGWGPGRFYMLPKDANDKVIWEPIRIWNRRIHVAANGLTQQQCTDREGTNMTASKLATRPASVGSDIPEADGVLKYGEIPALELAQDAAKLYFQAVAERTNYGGCFELLFKSGDTFDFWSGGGAREMRGFSPLHPIRIGTYGGDAPAFVRNIPAYDNCIVQGRFQTTGKTENDGVKFFLLEDVDFRVQPSFSPGKRRNQFVTMRRYMCYDIYPRTPFPLPANPAIWHVKPPHEVGTYFAGFSGVLIEDSFQDLIGWAPDYDYAADIDKPYPVNQFSHCLYIDGGNSDITVRRSGYSRGSLTVYQMRSGGLFYDNFSMGSNQQMSVGPGKEQDPVSGSYNGNYAYFLDNTFTWAGQKREDIDNMNSDLGIRSQSWDVSLRNCVLMHSGEPPVFAVDRAWPITKNNNAYNFDGGRLYLSDLLVYGWNDKPNENIDGLDIATLNATTIEAYNDEWKSVTGSHRNDLIANLRALDEPWIQAQHMNAWFLGRTGRAKPTRATPRTMVFEPYATGETPGIRWDIRLDWSTYTLPGVVPGDSVDLNGYHVNNFDTPDYPLVDLSFGGGKLTQCGGRVTLTGNILDAGEIVLDGAGQLYMGGGTVPAGLTTRTEMGGRFANTGALTCNGDISVSGRAELLFGIGDGDSFAMNGDLTVSGQARVGFDGTSGAASLTLAGTTTFHPIARLKMDSSVGSGDREVRFGTVLTGETSGFTGVVEYLDYWGDEDEFYVQLRVLSGTPQNGEMIRGEEWFGNQDGWKDLGTTRICQVIEEPSYIMGKIESFNSGVHGTDLSGMATTVTLGGNLVVDESNLPPGTYNLIEAGAIVGDFASKPANVTVTATAVQLSVA